MEFIEKIKPIMRDFENECDNAARFDVLLSYVKNLILVYQSTTSIVLTDQNRKIVSQMLNKLYWVGNDLKKGNFTSPDELIRNFRPLFRDVNP